MAKILIVDDEPLITAMMEDWLSELGHVVVGPAHNLAERWSWRDGDIDAAVVDVSLGKDNSYPLVEALVARGVPFALGDGLRARGNRPEISRSSLCSGSHSNFATFRATIDQLTAQSGRSQAPNALVALLYLSDALIASSAFDPGHNSRSESSFSGRSAVPRTSCRSSASSSR